MPRLQPVHNGTKVSFVVVVTVQEEDIIEEVFEEVKTTTIVGEAVEEDPVSATVREEEVSLTRIF